MIWLVNLLLGGILMLVGGRADKRERERRERLYRRTYRR